MSGGVLENLVDRVLARDPRAIARAITLVENESADGVALVGRIFPKTGRAFLIGLTGPPGAGKSTLADRLVTGFRQAGATVAVLAVDPTSPYSGGAILGDRVRMQLHAQDAGVFIRSMATRGHLGGLARTTADAAVVLDAAGFDLVIIETVGVGQGEVEIARTADLSVVIAVPGAGDDVQALKAGIMEIADIFVVNKADREGADRTAAAIETTLSLAPAEPDRPRPPVLLTEATTGRGLPELFEAIQGFRGGATSRLDERRRVRADWRLRETLARRFMQHVERRALGAAELDEWLTRIMRRELDPYAAAEMILGEMSVGGGADYSLDHVGIAVKDATTLVALFKEMFDLDCDDAEIVGPHRLRFVATGAATIELVEPVGPDSPVIRFLETRGPGLHHVCLRVSDIDAALARLKAKGARLIDAEARPGAHGSRIAFLHPAGTGGVLIELKQR